MIISVYPTWSYACESKILQIIKWLDNVYRVVHETHRQYNMDWLFFLIPISFYNVIHI